MATTGTPGEILTCNNCGASARAMQNGKIRPHPHKKALQHNPVGHVKMCNG